jgi:hypothetical protein
MNAWGKFLAAIVIFIMLIVLLRISANISSIQPLRPLINSKGMMEKFTSSGYYGRDDIDCIMDPNLAECQYNGENNYW